MKNQLESTLQSPTALYKCYQFCLTLELTFPPPTSSLLPHTLCHVPLARGIGTQDQAQTHCHARAQPCHPQQRHFKSGAEFLTHSLSANIVTQTEILNMKKNLKRNNTNNKNTKARSGEYNKKEENKLTG